MSDDVDVFAAALHQEMLDEGFTHAEAVEQVEWHRQCPYWNDVAELWFTQRSKTPLGMLCTRRIEELRGSDYDALNPTAQLMKFLDAHPGAAAEFADEVNEELGFQGITAQFNDDPET